MKERKERTALYIPDTGISDFKRIQLNSMRRAFGLVVRKPDHLGALAASGIVPCVASFMELRDLVQEWVRTKRAFLYWDRGYLCRGGKTWLPVNGPDHFRFHVSEFQMREVRPSTGERLAKLRVSVYPWRREGRRIVVAAPSEHYAQFHGIEHWVGETVMRLRQTGRPVVVRHKNSRVPLEADLADTHCLVTHGSVAAVEAAVLGTPVIVDPVSAAATIGVTSLDDVEAVRTPDRTAWLRSLADNQFTFNEVARGMLWESL